MSVSMETVIKWPANTPAGVIALELRSIADSLSPVQVASTATAEAVTTPAKRGRPAKVAAPVAAETEEKDHIDMSDLLGDSEPELPIEKQPTWEEVLAAFKSFCVKNPREKAVQILAKFGAKSVKDLKPEQYKAVVAFL